MKRFIAILLTIAMIVPMAIGGLVLPASAAAPAAGKYVITGGGVAGSPDYALNTTTYTGAELGTILASTEASDSGVTFNADMTAESGEENFVVELVRISGSNYAIKLHNGYYLAAAGSTNLVSYKDYVNVEEAQWTIDKANNGTWSIHNVHSPEKYLGFSASAHYFRTFTSGGVAPVLYSFAGESSSSTHEVSLQQSIRSSGTGSITATYDGHQYYYPEDVTNTSIPTVFTVSDNARVTLYFEPSEGSALSKVRVNGIEKELTPSGDGYSLIVNGIHGNTYVTAVWVNGEIDNQGAASTAVTAEYDNAKYDLEGEAYSDPLSIATVNTAEILEGSVFTDKSVHYNEANQTFTNTLSLNSVAYETATSESVVIPMDVVVVLDVSASMNTASDSTFRMTEVVNGLNDLMSTIISASPDNRVGLVTYSGATTTGNSANNSTIDVPLAKHSNITLSYTNQNSGNTKSGSLSISADGRSAGTKTVTGGTYTQAGIARANQMFASLSDEDKTITINGQTYDRTPVLILVTDGLPTAANSNYTAATPGTSNYGNGAEGSNAAEGNAIFYTIRAAQHFRNQIKEMYNNNSRFRFFTIGVDMNPGTFRGISPVVLNPTSENIAAMTSTGEPYNTLRTGLNSTAYRNEYYKDGKYVSYADASYDVSTGTDALKHAFDEILKEAQAVVSHIMPVVDNSNVEFYDALGRDMELKSDPVLSYNGTTYRPTSTTQEGNKTVYHYIGTVQAYANGPTVNLSRVVVTTEKDANGIWIVRWNVPSELVPAYVYDEASDSYIPAQTATVSYEVAPTDAALAAVTSTRTFYSNNYEEGYHAYSHYQLNPNSPFYNTYYGSLDPTLVVDKLENTSNTDEYIGYTTHKDGALTKELGNNGALVVSAKRADITVKKLWKNPDGSICEAPEGASITGQLWQKIDGKTDVMIDEVNLSAAENWQHTWENLVLRDENHTYSYFGKETAVFGANAYDYYTVEEPDENGELRISNYYNRMTITVNTDWYYNGVNETGGYENRTVNTLYYKDSTGALIPVSDVQPIVFDSTSGLTEDWNDMWTDLYIRHPDGTPIEYVVVQEIVNEDPRGEHTTFYTVEDNPREPECDSITGIVNPDPVVQIDNYLENPPIQVTVNKIWADNTGSSQDDITVALYRSATFDGVGRLIKSATFGKAQNWTYTFTELAPGYYYYVRETKVSGYTASYTDPVSQATDGSTPTVTVTNTPYPTTGVAVEKVWQTSSGTKLLDAGNMPSVRAKVWQIDHKVTEVPKYTVTVNFQGVYRYAWNSNNTKRTIATAKTLNNIPAGANVTLNFTNFGQLRLYSNYNNVNVALTSGDATLNTDSFTHNITTGGSTWSRTYTMNYGGSISLSDIRSDVVITISNGYVYSTSTTFGNQTAALSYTGGDTPVDETTEMLYQTVMLSAENDWHVSLTDLPTTKQEGNTTDTYTYYVEEQNSSYDPVYTNNDTEHGIGGGVIQITNTIYPEILPDVAVYDFGLPMDVEVLDNDRKSLNISGVTLTGVSTTAPRSVALNTGVSTNKQFGNSCGGTYGTFSILDNKVRFTPVTTNVPGVDTVYYEAFVPGVGYMYSKLEVAPATNVHFEESFLANNGYEIVGSADGRAQSDQNTLYGNDTAYNAYEENSLGRCYGVSVSDPSNRPNATFTFTGTGFDIISRSTPDSGVMVVEVHENNANGDVVRRFITDNYLAEDSLYQLPVVHCTDLDYGTYYVTVIAYYNKIFDHNLTPINVNTKRSASHMDMSGVFADLGWPEDAEYTYTPSVSTNSTDSTDSNTPAKRSIAPAAEGSYNVYVDGVRIYNPLGMSPTGVGGTLYTAAKEMNPEYVQIRKTLLDANNWNSAGADVNAALYIADKTTSNSPDEAFVTDGIYLSTNGVLNTKEENGRNYILDVNSERIQFKDQDVWTAVEGGTRKYYAGETELTKQELNTLELAYYDNVYRAKGPENEAYLQNGNGVAFAVDDNTGVHISAKSPNGQPVTLCVYDGTKWVAVATITSATEMFYNITPYTRNINYIIVKCIAEGDGILSLCQVKLIQGSAAKRSVRLNAAVAYAALKAMNGETEIISAEHQHVWTATANTATCNEAGMITYTCKVCGETRTAYAPAAGHSYALELKPAVACISDGTMTFTCTACGESVVRVLPRERHTYTQERVEAADGELGYTLFTCSGCGFSFKVMDDPCKETGHAYTFVDNTDGTHTTCCEQCGQSFVQPHAYENGVCACGATETESTNLKITSAYLHLTEDINLVYTAAVPTGCTDAYMVFGFNGAEYTVTDYTVDANGQYCFEFTNVTPQCLGDTICATVYCSKNGEHFAYTLEEYSVREYCERLLARYPDDAKLTALLSDLLVYGAAAQIYTDYRTDALVTDGLELTPSVFPEQPTAAGISFNGEADSATDWTAATLVLRNNLATRFTFKAEDVTDLTVRITINGRTQDFQADSFVPAGETEGTWYVEVREIQATEFNDTVSASFLRSGEQIGRTVNYSVNTYIAGAYGNEAAPTLAQLVRALYNYGCSASNYAN